MKNYLSKLQHDVREGRMEPWNGALLKAWIETNEGSSVMNPRFEDLAELLLDQDTVTALESEAQGPWEVLKAQARSIGAHQNVGLVLVEIHELIIAHREKPEHI